MKIFQSFARTIVQPSSWYVLVPVNLIKLAPQHAIAISLLAVMHVRATLIVQRVAMSHVSIHCALVPPQHFQQPQQNHMMKARDPLNRISRFEYQVVRYAPGTKTKTVLGSLKDNLNVLILNNYVSNNFPKMVNFKGEEQNDLYFVQGRDTDIQYGCSTKFRGEFWTFGGRGAPNKNQVFDFLISEP